MGGYLLRCIFLFGNSDTATIWCYCPIVHMAHLVALLDFDQYSGLTLYVRHFLLLASSLIFISFSARRKQVFAKTKILSIGISNCYNCFCSKGRIILQGGIIKVARAALFACVFFRAGVCSMMDGKGVLDLTAPLGDICMIHVYNTLHSLRFPLSFFYFIARGATG